MRTGLTSCAGAKNAGSVLLGESGELVKLDSHAREVENMYKSDECAEGNHEDCVEESCECVCHHCDEDGEED